MRFCLVTFLFSWASAVAGSYAGLWLNVSNQVIPAGGTGQIRITLTEPKPIIRTRLYIEFDAAVIEEITSFSIYSENGEAVGTAFRSGNRVRIEAASKTGKLGNTEELPLLTMEIKLKPGVPLGKKTSVRILPESTFVEPDGEDWHIEDNQAGVLEVGETLAVDAVVPSGGFIAKGQPVRILGRGFVAWSRVSISGQPDLKASYVSPTEMQVVGWNPYQLDQRELAVVNPDQSEVRVFTFLQGRQIAPSAFDLLAATRPLFSVRADRSGEFVVPDDHGTNGRFSAMALQNPHETAVAVRFDFWDPSQGIVITNALTLAPHERISRDLTELIPGFSIAPGTRVQIMATESIQMLGITGDPSTGTVLPVPVFADSEAVS